MLVVKNLCKDFKGFMAVNGANLDVKKGEIVAVIGPNGAGKTTLFNLITGHLKPTSGVVQFKGEDITGLAPYKICKRGISRSFQIVNVFSKLTVFENVQLALFSKYNKTFKMLSKSSKFFIEETENILDKLGLLDKKNINSELLSHGDQKVLEIAIALASSPDLLILDEPTAGMAPKETERCIELIKKLSREYGLTILFCEHDMKLVFDIADRIMVMVRGSTIIQGKPEEVRCNEIVQKAYLGDVC